MKVGICIPNYNMQKYIKGAIESALAQTYKNCTIYILDNASSDNSWSIIEEYKKKYSNIKVYKNKYTITMEENWNKLLRLAENENYINILSSDDRLHPTYVSECMNIHKESNFTTGYVYSEKEDILNGKAINNPYFYENTAIIPFYEEFFINIIGFHTAPCQLLIDNNILKEIDYLSTSFGMASDMHMTLKINSNYNVGYIQKKLVDYNISSGMSADYEITKLMAMHFYRLKRDILINYLPLQLSEQKNLLIKKVDTFCAKFCLSKIRDAINNKQYQKVKKLFYIAVSFELSLAETELYQYISQNKQYDVDTYYKIYQTTFSSIGQAPYKLPKFSKISKVI